MNIPPRQPPPLIAPWHSRDLRRDAFFVVIGVLIVIATWSGEETFSRDSGSKSVPVVFGLFVVVRGFLGRWPSGYLRPQASVVSGALCFVALYLIWHFIGAE